MRVSIPQAFLAFSKDDDERGRNHNRRDAPALRQQEHGIDAATPTVLGAADVMLAHNLTAAFDWFIAEAPDSDTADAYALAYECVPSPPSSSSYPWPVAAGSDARRGLRAPPHHRRALLVWGRGVTMVVTTTLLSTVLLRRRFVMSVLEDAVELAKALQERHRETLRRLIEAARMRRGGMAELERTLAELRPKLDGSFVECVVCAHARACVCALRGMRHHAHHSTYFSLSSSALSSSSAACHASSSCPHMSATI